MTLDRIGMAADLRAMAERAEDTLNAIEDYRSRADWYWAYDLMTECRAFARELEQR